ncbi:MAG: hypothetical protein ACREIE_09495, partial [Nitrospiraceae bacterium]
MKIDDYKPIRRTDVQGALPWIDRFMDPVNEHLKTLTTMAQGQIGPDNENKEIRQVRLRHEEPVEIVLTKLRGAPIGGSLLWTGIMVPWTWSLEIIDVKRVRVLVSWKTAPLG